MGVGGSSGSSAWCSFHLTEALDTCWNLRFSLGHPWGDSSCTWCVDACGGGALAECLLAPRVPESCGVSLLGSAFSWAQVLPRMPGSRGRGGDGLDGAISQGDCGSMAGPRWGTDCSPGCDKVTHGPESTAGPHVRWLGLFLPSV